jgi:hypothetical protein
MPGPLTKHANVAPILRSAQRASPLPRGEGQGEGQTGSPPLSRLPRAVSRYVGIAAHEASLGHGEGKTGFDSLTSSPLPRLLASSIPAFLIGPSLPHRSIRAHSAKMNKTSTKMNTPGGGGVFKKNGSPLPQFAPVSTPPKIVKIGELADFQPMRPRCTNYLRRIKIGVRRFSQELLPILAGRAPSSPKPIRVNWVDSWLRSDFPGKKSEFSGSG